MRDYFLPVMIPKGLFVIIIFLYCSSMVLSQYPDILCGAVYSPEGCENATVEALISVKDFVRCAPAKLPPFFRDYIWSGSGSEMTMKENNAAYQKIHIRKRVIIDLPKKDLSTTVLGHRISIPIGISPTNGQAFYHPEGDIGSARGATKMGTLMILSSYASIPLEKVAESAGPNSYLWMQTLMFPNRSDVAQLVKRAEKAGFKAIVVTVDDAVDTTIKCDAYRRFLKEYTFAEAVPNIGHPFDRSIDPRFTLKDITWLRRLTKLPIVAKGVMTGEDAVRIMKAGATAIFVSNHGGRELDGSLPTIDVLAEVVDTLRVWRPGTEVYVDGGVYSGFDVFKAIARGARAVFIGRLNLWGLTIGGEKGVAKVLTLLKNEFNEAMLHAGYQNPGEIRRKSDIPPKPPKSEIA